MPTVLQVAMQVAVPACWVRPACRYGAPGLAVGAGAHGCVRARGMLARVAGCCVLCFLFYARVLLLTVCMLCGCSFVLRLLSCYL